MQYEILNKPLEEIAQDAFTTEKAIQTVAERNHWKQWFPEPDLNLSSDEPATPQTTDDMEAQVEEFTKRTSLRLQMFNLVKEILLTQKYLALEVMIIDKAHAIAANVELEPRDIKALSALYVDMTKNSLRDSLSSFSFGEDASGLPTVIFKDLSGRGKA